MKEQFEPLAVAGYRRSGKEVTDDFLPSFSSRQGRRTLRQMADNDETLGAVLLALATVYRSVEVHVDENDNDTEGKYSDWLSNALFNDFGDRGAALRADTGEAFVQTLVYTEVFGFGLYDICGKYLHVR